MFSPIKPPSWLSLNLEKPKDVIGGQHSLKLGFFYHFESFFSGQWVRRFISALHSRRPLAHILLNIILPLPLQNTSEFCPRYLHLSYLSQCSITLSSLDLSIPFQTAFTLQLNQSFTRHLLDTPTIAILSARDIPEVYHSMRLSQLCRTSSSFFVTLQAFTPYNRTGRTHEL